jgi:hypothetical protein
VNELEPVGFGGFTHERIKLASAHGRKKSNVVAGREWSVPSGKLLISRRDQGGTKSSELREAYGVVVEQIGQGRTGGQFGSFLAEAGQLAHTPEE